MPDLTSATMENGSGHRPSWPIGIAVVLFAAVETTALALSLLATSRDSARDHVLRGRW
jgi:hypothetical protein